MIIKEIQEKFNIKKENINMNSRFLEDLNLDSIDLVETLMEVEEKYDLSISDEISIKTVEDFVNAVLEAKNAK